MKKNKKELPKVDPVKIKPLFGMKPGLWLSIAYLLAILLLFFAIGILPDLIDGHKRVTFTSAAYNAAVYVDDVYEGGTPFTRKIASGTHTVSYRVNGYEIDSFTIKVGRPVLFNWLFPRKQSVASTATLTEEAFKALSSELLEDANAYSAILQYDDVHRYNPIFTTYAKSIATSQFAKNTDALQAALLFVDTPEMYGDAKVALEILDVKLEIPYSELAEGKTVGIEMEEPEVKAKKTTLKTDFFTIEGFEIPQADFSDGKTADASYPAVMKAGKAVHTDAFSIGAYCITEYQYAQFVAQNPQWSLDNKENLISQGLVDDYYLDGVSTSLTAVTNKPVRNISWNAAHAFCTWLSEISGRNVYLPTEDQWIAASLSDSEGGFQRSLMPSVAESAPAAMIGSVWEMTGTRFIPMARISDDQLLQNALDTLQEFGTATDMVVKGGSYVSDMNSIDRYSTGATYRSLCSDYMGFRIAWN